MRASPSVARPGLVVNLFWCRLGHKTVVNPTKRVPSWLRAFVTNAAEMSGAVILVGNMALKSDVVCQADTILFTCIADCIVSPHAASRSYMPAPKHQSEAHRPCVKDV